MQTDTLKQKVWPISPLLHKLAATAILDIFMVPVVLFVRHLVMLKSFKNFETLIRKRRTLGKRLS